MKRPALLADLAVFIVLFFYGSNRFLLFLFLFPSSLVLARLENLGQLLMGLSVVLAFFHPAFLFYCTPSSFVTFIEVRSMQNEI
jgi:hypothetical protein